MKIRRRIMENNELRTMSKTEWSYPICAFISFFIGTNYKDLSILWKKAPPLTKWSSWSIVGWIIMKKQLCWDPRIWFQDYIFVTHVPASMKPGRAPHISALNELQIPQLQTNPRSHLPLSFLITPLDILSSNEYQILLAVWNWQGDHYYSTFKGKIWYVLDHPPLNLCNWTHTI